MTVAAASVCIGERCLLLAWRPVCVCGLAPQAHAKRHSWSLLCWSGAVR